MKHLSDIEIAQNAKLKPISEVARDLGVEEKYLEVYGTKKAKIDFNLLKEKKNEKDGRLILVTAINPTPMGEGKTTTTVGLGDALKKLGKKTCIALREPSLGPVFGIKGGAAGGGYAQVVPMEDINLHFTGDIHAITAANNLIAAMLDNHIKSGNELSIDLKKIVWKRCLDINDRQLRFMVNGLGSKADGVTREDSFDITVASEVMAVLCLSEDIIDLKQRLKRMILAYDKDGKPVTAGDIKAEGAAAALLKDAIKPNLVQTLENTPALIHGGPFANIAHGCNTVLATKMALKLSDYTVTEAGFGADLGAEKFFDIKCRTSGLKPDAVVLVATIRALYHHGNGESLDKGIDNLLKHIENITKVYKLPVVVALNKFPNDKDEDIKSVSDKCESLGVKSVLSDVWARGGDGGIELANEVIKMIETGENNFTYAYKLEKPLKDKIFEISTKIYGAKGVSYSNEAEKQVKELEDLGLGNLPVCVAKTQYSLSDDPKKLGRPVDYDINVKKIKPSTGAGFIVVLTGDIMTMPGLPKKPAAETIDVDESGRISGLF